MLDAEIVTLEQAVIKNPDDRRAARALNDLRLQRPDRISAETLRIVVGPCPSDHLWFESLTPWAASVAFNFGQPADSSRDCVVVPYADSDVREILSRLPKGFEPHLILLMLPEIATVPRGLDESPVPVVLYVQDFLLGIPKLLALAEAVDGIACMDRRGLGALGGLGAPTFFAPGNGYAPDLVRGAVRVNRPVDVSFLAGFDRAHVNPAYLDRDRTVLALSSLQDRLNVLISARLDLHQPMQGPNYLAALRKTKILVCHTTTDRLHPSVSEGMAAGAMVMLNRGNSEVESRFAGGDSIVYYTQYDLVDKINFYLDSTDMRLAIARRGQELITQVGTHTKLAGQAVAALAEHRKTWTRARPERSANRDLLAGVVSTFEGAALRAREEFARAMAGRADPAPCANNLGVAELLMAGSSSGGERDGHLQRAERLFIEAAGQAMVRPAPMFNLAVLMEQRKLSPGVDLLEALETLAANPAPDAVSPYELIVPPEMASAESYVMRQSRMYWEWASLIARFPTGGREFAQGLATLACWRAWGMRRDFLAANGDRAEALEAAAASMKHLPADPAAAMRYAEIAVDLGRLEPAAAALGNCIAQRPLDLSARLLYGAVLDRLGRADELAELTRESEPLARIVRVST